MCIYPYIAFVVVWGFFAVATVLGGLFDAILSFAYDIICDLYVYR